MPHIKPAFCRFDPAHLFDGLFVPTKGRKRGRLYVEPREFNGMQVSFQGFEQLGADDQSLLLAISAQLGIDGLLIDDEAGPIARQLKLDLQLTGYTNGANGATPATKKTTLYSLLVDAGYKDPNSAKDAHRALNRLANAQVREINKKTGWDRRCNLISTNFNRMTGETYIAANPRLAGALFSGQHVKISLYERNALESEAAKLLHCWLCSNVRLGASLGNGNGVKLDTLLPHIYGPGHEAASAKVKSVRRGNLRDALDEIRDQTAELHNGYGWQLDQTSSGLVMVSRPKDIPLVETIMDAIAELDRDPLPW